jgi:hypothetical protein
LQFIENLTIPFKVFTSFKVGRPYQPLDEDDARSRIRQFEDREVAFHRRMRADLEWEHLDRDVRQRRGVQELGQLRCHDLASSHHPVQCRLIEHDTEAGRAFLPEDALPGELCLYLQLDLIRAETGHGTFVAGASVIRCLQESVHHR